MTVHKEDCSFLNTVKELKKHSFGSNGNDVSIYEDRIDFSDGWNFLPSIEFKYCPECGAKIENKQLDI